MIIISNSVFAYNTVKILEPVQVLLKTADTAVNSTVTLQSGGEVKKITTGTNYLDISLENLSQINLNAEAGKFFQISKSSGSDDFTITPSCATSTAEIRGTGTETTLRIEVIETNICIYSVIVSESGGSTNVSEAGITDTYTLVLSTQPLFDVQIQISTLTNLTVSPTTITFTPLNWNTPQTITVSAVNDLLVEGTHTETITHSATSLDPNFNGIGISNITATITDNDTAPISGGGGGVVLPIYLAPTQKTQDKEQGQTIIDPTGSGQEAFTCDRNENTEIPFSDIENHWANENIKKLYQRCIIDGKNTIIFAPNDAITRAEIVKILLNTYKIPTSEFQKIYDDVNENDWFSSFVTRASQLKIVEGYFENGKNIFKPNQFITRAEASKVIVEAKGIKDLKAEKTSFVDVSEKDWHNKYIAFLEKEGILEGYPENYTNNGLVQDFYTLNENLSLNMRSNEVAKLREILNQLGYYSNKTNNIFDQELEEIIKKYQKDNDLEQLGLLGPKTRESILNKKIVPISIKLFKPNNYITRGEISKITLLVEKL